MAGYFHPASHPADRAETTSHFSCRSHHFMRRIFQKSVSAKVPTSGRGARRQGTSSAQARLRVLNTDRSADRVGTCAVAPCPPFFHREENSSRKIPLQCRVTAFPPS